MASTHLNDPTLPTGIQAPVHMANLAMFKETDGNYANESQPFKYVMAATLQVMRAELSNIEQAKTQTDWPKWDQSICHELDQLEQMQAWELVNPPKDANIVRSHFMFHYKLM